MPVVVDIVFRRLCDAISDVITNRFTNIGTLTTINTSCPVAVLFVTITGNSGVKYSIMVSRLFNKGHVARVGATIGASVVSSLVLSLVLATINLSSSGILLGTVKAPSGVVTSSIACLGVCTTKVTFLFVCGVDATIFATLNSSGAPLCFLVFSSLAGVTLSLVFTNPVGVKITKIT